MGSSNTKIPSSHSDELKKHNFTHVVKKSKSYGDLPDNKTPLPMPDNTTPIEHAQRKRRSWRKSVGLREVVTEDHYNELTPEQKEKLERRKKRMSIEYHEYENTRRYSL